MPEIELSSGTVDFVDTGGAGPVVVLTGGLIIGGSLWRHVVGLLEQEYRCLVPTLPLGAHRHPMRADVRLTPYSVAMLLGEFLDRLDLREVTLVENDTGRAQTLAGERPDRLARLVLASCEAFDNYPPGLPGRLIAAAARMPGGIGMLVQPMRLCALRRLPIAYGWMAKRPIPHSDTDDWLQPVLSDRAIRTDLSRYLRSCTRNDMTDAAEKLAGFTRPVLVVWAGDDKVMPLAHGRRLADLVPDGHLVEIPDSYTLIPHDQPAALATAIDSFVRATS
jgi:pimeloyl-ACP methyl ester carboxylesterase